MECKSGVFVAPTSFQLGCHQINVEQDETLLHNQDNLGEARYRDLKIKLLKPSESNPIPVSKQHQIFNHELVHWIFFMLGEDELCSNEKLVDNFANYLTQYEQSREYA